MVNGCRNNHNTHSLYTTAPQVEVGKTRTIIEAWAVVVNVVPVFPVVLRIPNRGESELGSSGSVNDEE